MPQYPPVSFSSKFITLSVEGRELMRHMLSFRPDARITARAAISSSYFSTVRDPVVEAIPPSMVEADDIERCPLEVPRLRALMAQEIQQLKQRQAGSDAGATSPDGSSSVMSSPTSEAVPAPAPEPGSRSSWRAWRWGHNPSSSTSTVDVPPHTAEKSKYEEVQSLCKCIVTILNRGRGNSVTSEEEDGPEEDVTTLWHAQTTTGSSRHEHEVRAQTASNVEY
jgi:hypothetical protein